MSLDKKIPPPLVAALLAGAMWAVASFGPRLPLDGQLCHVLTGVLVAAGLAFDILGLGHFVLSRTTVNPHRPERASLLVTGGVYRISRNPMYAGLALLLLALAIHLAALLPFAGPILFMLYMTRFQIRPEEQALLARFGEEYARYMSRVRRWL